eukprot:s97_g23.t1
MLEGMYSQAYACYVQVGDSSFWRFVAPLSGPKAASSHLFMGPRLWQRYKCPTTTTTTINPFKRIWCLFEIYRLKHLKKPFELICSEGSLSQPETCQNRAASTEMLQATFKALWSVSAAKAQSSVAADKYQIWAEVANTNAKGMIDGFGAGRFFQDVIQRRTDELKRFFTDFDGYMMSLLSTTMLQVLLQRGEHRSAAECCLYGAQVDSAQATWMWPSCCWSRVPM